jgi:hypothetical protein
MANFLDTMIDYPNAKMYVFALFDQVQALQLLNQTQVNNYKQHVENLEKFDEDME